VWAKRPPNRGSRERRGEIKHEKLGLSMNFNAEVLKDGLVRVVNDRAD
jgi:hypothetical protein